MAIDTQNKRRSVQGMHLGQVRPLADGTISEPDRAAVVWLYYGIDYESPVVSTGANYFRKFLNFIRRRVS